MFGGGWGKQVEHPILLAILVALEWKEQAEWSGFSPPNPSRTWGTISTKEKQFYFKIDTCGCKHNWIQDMWANQTAQENHFCKWLQNISFTIVKNSVFPELWIFALQNLIQTSPYETFTLFLWTLVDNKALESTTYITKILFHPFLEKCVLPPPKKAWNCSILGGWQWPEICNIIFVNTFWHLYTRTGPFAC